MSWDLPAFGPRPPVRSLTAPIALCFAGAVLLLCARAAAGQDVFASSGPAHACERARNHWLASPEEFQSSGGCCLVWLQEAYAEQVAGLEYFEAAAMASGDEARELVRLGNRAIARRGKLLAEFRDCSNEVQHALGVAEAGGDATGLMPAGCGPPKPEVFGSTSGLGSDVADDWYHSRIPARVRRAATCCVGWLERARSREQKALEAFWQASEPGVPDSEAEILRDRAQALFADRRRFLLFFSKCVHRVWDELTEPPVCGEQTGVLASEVGAENAPASGEVCDAAKETLKGYVDETLGEGAVRDKITIGDDFPVPDEPDVDWEQWYRDWVKLVKTEVWDKLRKHFCSDTNSYFVDMKYEVRRDHTIAITFLHTEGTDPKNGENFRLSIERLFNAKIQGKVPAFPPRTKYGTPGKPLIRTFNFRHNADSFGLKLGGPPAG